MVCSKITKRAEDSAVENLKEEVVGVKKLEKCFLKLDTIWIILGGLVFLIYAYVIEADASMKLFYTSIIIPFYWNLLQNILIKKQENNYCNVDLYMKEKVEDEIIWKLRADNSQENITYLCIKNTGKIDIFSIYIKVIKNDGTIGWFHIPEMLNAEKKCDVCVPYTKDSIKEIVLSCSVQTEYKTKKFNGIKSGNEDMTIFSNSELFDSEKYAIHHEKGFDVFERMERFFM